MLQAAATHHRLLQLQAVHHLRQVQAATMMGEKIALATIYTIFRAG